MKYIVSTFLLLVLVISGGYVYMHNKTKSTSNDYKNTSYIIDGQTVVLIDGKGVVSSTPESASKTTVTYFGNEVSGDMDNDGIKDIAFLVTENTGGSGTFYYIAFAHGTANGYQGINMLFIGDRIAPQTTEYRDGQIIVNYADRKINEPMTTTPSVGISKYFIVANGMLSEKN